MDYKKIAKLHVKSWQQHYRGDFSDHFLDVEATSEREEVWKDRLTNPSPNQYCLGCRTEWGNLWICLRFLRMKMSNSEPFWIICMCRNRLKAEE